MLVHIPLTLLSFLLLCFLNQQHDAVRRQADAAAQKQAQENRMRQQHELQVRAQQQDLLGQPGNPVLPSHFQPEHGATAATRLLTELSSAIQTKFGSRSFQVGRTMDSFVCVFV